MQITDLQKVSLTAVFTDAAGNPVVAPDDVLWSVDDPTIATFVADGDPANTNHYRGTATAVGAIGSTIVRAKIGDGSVFSSSIPITVVGSTPTGMHIDAGTPVSK